MDRPSSVARVFARVPVLFTKRISGTPSSRRATHTPRDAPPAPRTTAGPVSARQPSMTSRMFSKNP